MPVRPLAGLIFFVFEPNNPIPSTLQTTVGALATLGKQYARKFGTHLGVIMLMAKAVKKRQIWNNKISTNASKGSSAKSKISLGGLNPPPFNSVSITFARTSEPVRRPTGVSCLS